MQSFKLKTIIFSLFLGLFSTSLNAEVYRWTDDKGRVHFGDRPSEKADKVDIKANKAPASTLNDAKRKQKASQFLRARELDKIEKERKDQKLKNHAAKKAKNCKNAKRELRKLREARLLYTLDKSGKKHYVSDAERVEEEKKTLKVVEQWCN